MLAVFAVLWLAALGIILFFEKVKRQIIEIKINLTQHES